MTVVIANKIPAAIRGCLKTWFIEPKPNVFISNINNALAERIVHFLKAQCKNEPGFILIQSTNTGLGYKIINIGKPDKEKTLSQWFRLILKIMSFSTQVEVFSDK